MSQLEPLNSSNCLSWREQRRRKGCRIRPGEYWGEDYLAQAERLYIAGDHRQAFSKAVQPIESNPLGWSAYMLAGRCLEMLDKDDIRRNTEFIQDEDTPEDYYQSALIHAPGDAERASALVELGRLAEERRAHSEALKHFETRPSFGRSGR